jgi:hypothetical protein
VLEFCEYVLADATGKFKNDNIQLLRWADQTIAELLSTGLESAGIPHSERGPVWSLLEQLSEAADPTPDSESVTSGVDAATLSLNATRSVALHAVVRYALWIRRSIEGTPDQAALLAKGFDEMPEVRQRLDRHLDESKEMSIAVRAVYGQWFPWLLLLDAHWAAAAAPAIFPAAEDSRRFWDAAWGTYITFCRPYDNVFDVIEPQYAQAVTRIVEAASVSSTSVDAKLAEHLMVLYWRGKVSLPPDGELLAGFYKRATGALAAHALAFVGQSLTGSKGSVPSAIIGRLQSLWKSRLNTAQAEGGAGPFRPELASFGWWFASGQFPEEWALSQLIRVLRLVGTIQADYQIVRRLPTLAADYPLMAVETLGLLFETDKEGLADGWELYPRSTLETALKSKDAAVEELVYETIDRLGARGHLEFRDLFIRR